MGIEGMTRRALGVLLSVASASLAAAQHPGGPEQATSIPNTPEFHVTRWTRAEGLSQGTVTSIEESRDGFLWIGTFGDLLRFDGQTFQSVGSPDADEGTVNRILSLAETRDGTLWVGTVEHGLLRFDEDKFTHVGERAPFLEIWNLCEDTQGTLWVGGSGALGRVTPDGVELVLPLGVHGLSLDANGVCWAATDGGVWKLDGEPQFMEHIEREVFHIALDAKDTLWAFGDSFVAEIQGDRLGPTAPTQSTFDRCSTVDGDGNLLTGGTDALWSYRRSADEPSNLIATEQPALPEHVRALHRDHKGNIWAGTQGRGLVRLARTPFRRLTGPEGVHSPVRGLAATNNEVWMENFRTYLLRHDASGLSRINTNYSGDGSVVRILGGTSNNVLWAWGEDGNLIRVEPIGKCDAVSLPYKEMVGAVYDGENTWFGCELGLVQFDGESYDLVPLENLGLVKPTSVDADGSLRFFYQGGVGHYDRGKLTLNALGQTPIAEWRDMTFDASGTGWISTYGGGLLRFRDGMFQRISQPEGLGDRFLGGLIPYGGCLYINTNSGVMVASIADLNFLAQGSRDGIHVRMLLTGEGNGAMTAVGPDGKFWFPSVDGVTVVDPDLARPVTSSPPVLMGAVVADNSRIAAIDDAIEVSPGTFSLEINYSAVTLSRQNRVNFRYRMLGSDDEWIEAGERRAAYFTHLAPGDYVFEVAASSEGSGWSPTPTRLPVSVLPFIYETWWFRTLIVSAVLGFVFALYRYRVGLLRRHNAELQLEIVERKRLEEERRQIEERLSDSQRLEAIGRLAGGIAHDFNNVLTAMLGRSDLLADSLAVRQDADLSEHVQSLHDSGHRAASLTRQLLAFSRQQVLQPKVLDANHVISGLDSMLRHLMPDHVLMGLEIRAQGAHVRVDPSQLEQVVMNLVLNARDAMPSGGQIRVHTESVELNGETNHLNPEGRTGPHFVISVADTGEGIDEATLPHVFEPFFTTKHSSLGTGLGLASVHGIVNQSGGFVTVDSAPKQGTTFRVHLPVVRQEPVVVVQPQAPVQLNGPETILLCDDDDQVRETLTSLLQNHGYRVHATSGPSQALEVAESLPGIRLLITDVIMPEMDGRQLATEMEARHPHIRVLFISGYLNDIDLNLDVDSGSSMKGFLEKPFAPVRLLREVRRLLVPDARSLTRQ